MCPGMDQKSYFSVFFLCISAHWTNEAGKGKCKSYLSEALSIFHLRSLTLLWYCIFEICASLTFVGKLALNCFKYFLRTHILYEKQKKDTHLSGPHCHLINFKYYSIKFQNFQYGFGCWDVTTDNISFDTMASVWLYSLSIFVFFPKKIMFVLSF